MKYIFVQHFLKLVFSSKLSQVALLPFFSHYKNTTLALSLLFHITTLIFYSHHHNKFSFFVIRQIYFSSITLSPSIKFDKIITYCPSAFLKRQTLINQLARQAWIKSSFLLKLKIHITTIYIQYIATYTYFENFLHYNCHSHSMFVT